MEDRDEWDKEEWFEEIEDERERSFEPIETISQHPLDFLLNTSQENKWLRLTIDSLLIPLKRALDSANRRGNASITETQKLQLSLSLLNDLLIALMEKRFAVYSEDMLAAVADIIVTLRGYIGLESNFIYSSDLLRRLVIQHLDLDVRTLHSAFAGSHQRAYSADFINAILPFHEWLMLGEHI